MLIRVCCHVTTNLEPFVQASLCYLINLAKLKIATFVVTWVEITVGNVSFADFLQLIKTGKARFHAASSSL